MTKQLSVHIHKKTFQKENTSKKILQDISFSVQSSEIVSIIGKSGKGKTTLLRISAGLDTSFEGNVIQNNQKIINPNKETGFVFQEARLIPWMTTYQNIQFAIPKATMCQKEITKTIEKVLMLCDLQKERDSWPRQLSGGQAKRVSLARALAQLPNTILLDEPFTGLDACMTEALQKQLLNIHKTKHTSMMLVTHDIEEAVYLSDRVIILGGTPTTIIDEIKITMNHPRNRSSKQFIKTIQELKEKLHKS